MNSGPTSERVYDVLRHRLLTRVYGPGQRLDPSILARDLATSITPVRDALHLLAGRGLVDVGTGEGFHVVQIDAPALVDLYAWNLGVLSLALRSWPRTVDRSDSAFVEPDAFAGDTASQMAALCLTIGQMSSNAEHRPALEILNDRLQPIRMAEASLIEDPGSELRALRTALAARESRALRQLLVPYHRRRQRKAAEIVRVHYRR
ncbi:GntR family transcriptional regulator [Sphingomonas paeninsulae]|uniref:GntR family transcriptional regulator n=1 Tax=Sphingomonas paeninsulae TaxID=2319844 RepID=UPI0013CEE88C|nr:GntR family transcriptional regulator [Sphingomonas paeninsulae]